MRGRVMQRRATCGNDGGTGVSGHCSAGQQSRPKWWQGFRLRFQEASAGRTRW
ncbi:hypothetical protein HanRHA438_Chr07g0317881 [Helianthus annuus]|nr:hypothetical protein HanHA300_Chr07g0254621 [Helianthus annuus]KAJ0558180.1 hypothetical protein HanIR_Chr07g0333471 [Helianthus annuus]KAJ0564183.1 hypothetical protein HanHA89_Chr07g0271421 [Helianthus annuus]KAJ0732239.1 hypothetical protein HanOQP8_Chr07g0260961 [Helianthus annuus]KAJ0909106.1 hypothetical protein HanRHA438_Chr07g0317881 [Helianthus annuus]